MNEKMSSKGIIYIATGEKYIKAAVKSALRVKKFSPDVPIHLFSNWSMIDFKFENSTYPFTSVGLISEPHRRSKLDYMPQTPFDRTLYLDTDTAINSDITELFRLLEQFDIALAHAQHRNTEGSLAPWRVGIPAVYPQFNSGVILYRKISPVISLLNEWGRFFKESDHRHDQPILRELLWLSDLRIATLPPEYNVRYLKYHIFWSKSEAVTKIFHLKQLHKGWLNWAIRFPRRKFLKLSYKLGLRKSNPSVKE